MRELLVDTSAWYPLAVASHPDHARVRAALAERVADRFVVVTTNLIVAETHALLMRRVHGAAARRFVGLVREPPNVVVTATPALEETALHDWLDRFTDQPFSLTDAVSFAVMRERNIEEALALDHHFVVAGFTVRP
ncbi:MAG: PIN domain-containing protein [Gemmatimonadales bacterium]